MKITKKALLLILAGIILVVGVAGIFCSVGFCTLAYWYFCGHPVAQIWVVSWGANGCVWSVGHLGAYSCNGVGGGRGFGDDVYDV